MESPSRTLPSSLGGHPAFPGLSPLFVSPVSLSLSAMAPRRKSRSSTCNRLSQALLSREWATSNELSPPCPGCRWGHFLQDQRSQSVHRALRENWVKTKDIALIAPCARGGLCVRARGPTPMREGVQTCQVAEVPGGHAVS